MNEFLGETMNKTKCCIRGLSILAAAALAFVPASRVRAQGTPEKISLKEAVNLALKNSRQVALARAQYAAAQDAARVDRAGFLPNLYTGSGLAYTYGFPGLPGGQPPSVFNLSYTQDVWDPPARGQERAAEKRAENQRLELEKMRDAVTVRTASAYLELGKVRHMLDLLRSERTSAQRISDVSRQRVGGGIELPIEATRGELMLARIAQQIVQLEDRSQAIEDQLHDLTGIPSDQPIEVDQGDLPKIEEQPVAELVSQALQSSNDLKEAENERAARQEILKGNRGGYFPTFSLVGQYTVLSKFNNYSQFYNAFQRNNLNAGIQIQIPLFSARTSATVAQAHSDLNAAELMLSGTRRQTVVDTRQRAQAVRESDAAREVARLDLKLAQQSLGTMQSRFDQGQATLRDLEQARLEESQKWVAFLDADFAGQQAQLALLQETGQLAQLTQ
jgi:outer membrane protein TolC